MFSSDSRPKVIALVGPTAVGKTTLGIELAQRLDAEIISADSRLFYRGMDIGTAKPSKEQRERILHWLIDVADPDESWSLARFLDEANTAIDDVTGRDKLPLVVGGTGQFVRGLLDGWQPPGLDEDVSMRTAIQAAGDGSTLYEWLRVLDPDAAKNIDPRNVRRTIRALEVIFRTGMPFSDQRAAEKPPFRALKIGLMLERNQLYARIDQRVETMFASGFLEEVSGLLKVYPRDLRCFSAIGYPQGIAVVRGEMTEADAMTEIKRLTRVLVRRQRAWFKPNDPTIEWVTMDKDPLGRCLGLIETFLRS